MGPIQTISERTPLGHWTMHECRPAELKHLVESIWEVNGDVVNPAARHFPSGAVDLLLNLGAPQWLARDEGPDQFDTGDLWISGVQRHPVTVESSAHVHLFSVRVRAAAATAVFRVPMGTVGGRVLSLHEIDRAAARRLVEGIRSARTFERRAAMACRWIEAQRGSLQTRPDYLQWMSHAIEVTHGTAAIEPLRRQAAVSRKKLACDFDTHLGLTPKLLARVHRFRYARIAIQRPGASLAETAVRCGYFDQAHMSRDFKDLGDVTPGEYLGSCYPDGNSGIV